MKHDGVNRLIVLDSGLRAESGHHANFTRLLVDEARRRGWEWAVYCNQKVLPPLRAEFDARPHFRTSPYSLPHRNEHHPLAADLANYIELNDAYEEELRRLQLVTCAGNLILIPTISHNQLLGFARWATSPDAPPEGRFAVMLLFSPGWEVLQTGRELASAMYQHALENLASVPDSRIALLAETEPVARQFSELAGRSVHVAPWPTADAGLDIELATKEKDDLAIGYLGYAKEERGIHLLPEIVRQIASSCPPARFFVQVDTFAPPSVQAYVDAMQLIGDVVTIHHGSMPRERFLATLSGLDVVLMPYEPKAYRARGSALFSEAAMLGKVMVVPEGTWMAEQVANHRLGGVCFESFTAEAVAAALREALANLPALQTLSRAAADRWRQSRTAGAFLDRLEAVTTQRVPTPFGTT